MQPTDITALTNLVLWAALSISIAFGIIAHRTHFCTMGAVSDIFNMGDWTRMRQWALAVGVAMIGMGLLVYTEQIDIAKTLYASDRLMWLSAGVGGLMFGFGMVLASGCGSKTLVRMGGGSLKSVVVFIVMGISGFMTLKGITAVLRVVSVDQVAISWPSVTALPSGLSVLLGLSLREAYLVCAFFFGVPLSLWACAGRDFLVSINVLAGVGVGFLVISAWWISAHLGYVAEHPESLQEVFLATNSGKSEALSFVAPIAYTLDWLMFFSDKSKVLTVGIVSVAGVVIGSAVSSLTDHTFRWEGFGGVEDVANHLLGAVLMGVGGITAMGCTVGQGLSGIAALSVTSFVATFSIICGAVCALRYQVWRMESLA